GILWRCTKTEMRPSEALNWGLNGVGQAFGQVNGQIRSAENNVKNIFLNLFTSGGNSAHIQSSGRPLDGPLPLARWPKLHKHTRLRLDTHHHTVEYRFDVV